MTASDQSQGKKSMETGASNHMSNAVDIYYGAGIRITRAMKADIEAKSSSKNVSGEKESQLGAKKINSVRTSPRRKSATTKQDVQRKKQKAATSSAEQIKGMNPNQNEAQKDKKHNTPKQEKVTKKQKPNPSNYKPSVRQMRVMRSLALVAPLGSPFHKR